MQVSVDGTTNVLEVARAKNIKRVVFTSSKAAYGEITGEYAPPTCKPVREDYPKRPADLYGSLKVCCEELGRYYRETYGIEFIALRFVSIYGPGKEARHGPLSFYGQLIERRAQRQTWVIPQGGDQLNDAVYVGDVGRAVYLAHQSAGAERMDFQYRHGDGFDAERFFECGGQIVSQSQDRARSRPEQARPQQAELLRLRYFSRRRRTSVTSRPTTWRTACAITSPRWSGWGVQCEPSNSFVRLLSGDCFMPRLRRILLKSKTVGKRSMTGS